MENGLNYKEKDVELELLRKENKELFNETEEYKQKYYNTLSDNEALKNQIEYLENKINRYE